jgi:hypothetical protein
MVHVRVGQSDRRDAQNGPRALTDIETDIKLWNLDRCLFSGDADSLNAVGRQIQEAELSLTGGCAWQQSGTPSGAFSRNRDAN